MLGMDSSVPPPGLWSEDFKIRSYEVDVNRQASLETLCRYFQEAAWNHAEVLGAGYHDLQRINKFWVLSRLRLEIQRYPLWAEKVTVNTWPRAAKSVFALRDFELLDVAGARLGAGASAWLILDGTTRKPQRVDKLLASINISSQTRATSQEPEKLLSCGQLQTQIPVRVRYGDIDVNSHVNNSRYIGWLLDAYPIEFHRAHAAAVVDVNFLAETLVTDTISVVSQELAPFDYCHSIMKGDNAEEVCRARIQWRRSEPAHPAS
jgi:medium-chain acyl-[acyl-carrier-protein] hydrolase